MPPMPVTFFIFFVIVLILVPDFRQASFMFFYPSLPGQLPNSEIHGEEPSFRTTHLNDLIPISLQDRFIYQSCNKCPYYRSYNKQP